MVWYFYNAHITILFVKVK